MGGTPIWPTVGGTPFPGQDSGCTPHPRSERGGVPPSQVRMGGTPSQVRMGEGYPFPGQNVAGTPTGTAWRVLATRRSVCLLRSHRRTFLFVVMILGRKVMIVFHAFWQWMSLRALSLIVLFMLWTLPPDRSIITGSVAPHKLHLLSLTCWRIPFLNGRNEISGTNSTCTAALRAKTHWPRLISRQRTMILIWQRRIETTTTTN